MTTRQTPDAVREAEAREFLANAMGSRHWAGLVREGKDDNWGVIKAREAIAAILAALDSRAGDSGEVKAYRCRGCGWRGSEPIANGHPQNGCDLELMVHDPIATPAPAVDAVPAGEVE